MKNPNLNELSKRIDELIELRRMYEADVQLISIKQTLTAMLGELEERGYYTLPPDRELKAIIQKLIDKINGDET